MAQDIKTAQLVALVAKAVHLQDESLAVLEQGLPQVRKQFPEWYAAWNYMLAGIMENAEMVAGVGDDLANGRLEAAQAIVDKHLDTAIPYTVNLDRLAIDEPK